VGLRIENTLHGAAPVILCGYCGTRIHATQDGNYEWAGLSTEPGKRMAVYFLHKWCSPELEAQRGIALDSMELPIMCCRTWLRTFLIGKSLGVTPRHSVSSDQAFESL
jgi:hypothetical protein